MLPGLGRTRRPTRRPATLDDVTTPPFAPVTRIDLDVVRGQLGRAPRGVVGIAARCACGNPVVVATAPRLADGTPFPTFYYLTHPMATAALSRLEADGFMRELQRMLASDTDLRSAYHRAHQTYLRDRRRYGDVAEIADVSAGGMPARVKCLHALAAHALAAGPGVNPLGDMALQRCGWSARRCRCAAPGDGLAATPDAPGGGPRTEAAG